MAVYVSGFYGLGYRGGCPETPPPKNTKLTLFRNSNFVWSSLEADPPSAVATVHRQMLHDPPYPYSKVIRRDA